MNYQPCTVETCQATAATASPIPLCQCHAVEVALAVLPLALANALTNTNPPGVEREPELSANDTLDRRDDAREEIGLIYRLLDNEGWNAVELNRAMAVLNRPKATAARRLSEARKQYAAELGRRAGRRRREVEIDLVLALIEGAGDAKAVSLDDVMARFGMKRTTAWDRLDAARQLWEERQRSVTH